ncbi:hypothetical protein Hypma_000414, partial [Hypsizygus marmoreus]
TFLPSFQYLRTTFVVVQRRGPPLSCPLVSLPCSPLARPTSCPLVPATAIPKQHSDDDACVLLSTIIVYCLDIPAGMVASSPFSYPSPPRSRTGSPPSYVLRVFPSFFILPGATIDTRS